MERTPEPIGRSRFTRRVAIFEAPEVVEQLEQRAWSSGSSLAAIIRGAVRYLLAFYEEGEDE